MRLDLPTGTVTFVFTDVEGSTRLLDELGTEAYGAVLAEHHRVCREAWAAHDGLEVDTAGDAFFVVFARASDALAAAGAAQEALVAGGVRVRMGVHTGEVALTETGYVGMDVHRAARIAAAAHGGQVVVSASSRALAGDGFALVDLGEHRFKDLFAPERVFQLGEGEFPPLKSLYRTNLPVPASSFLGREREIRAVKVLLGQDRLVTLTGPGGTGKTRLALQAAAEVSERFPDGVWWVPLAPLRDPGLVLSAIARALGVGEEPGRALAESLCDGLRGRQALVLLDNIEHLLPHVADDIADLVAGAPTVSFLVTSRERLRLAGENVYAVPSLSDLDGAALFSARARQIDAVFEETPAVAQLCRRLDDLPLAIELAAARTAVFAPEQLLERLGQRLDLLKGGRDADPRQHTLRATIEWSHELLNDEEKQLFARLAVFAGGCSYDAAELVADADPDSLQSLIDKSLVRRTGERFWMLETIREYALESLDTNGQTGEQRSRHADCFLALAEQIELESRTSDQSPLFARLDADSSNLRAAIEWAREAEKHDCELRLATALWRYWLARGQVSEGRRWLEDALAPISRPPPRALVGLCSLRHLAADETKEVLDDARTALRACEASGDDFSLALAWNLIGQLEGSGLGHAASGEVAWQRALEHAERGNYLAEKAESMGWLMVMTVFGPLPTDEGIERCKQFFEKAGDDLKVRAFAQVERAVLEAMRGEFVVARALLEAGHHAFRTLGLNVWAANNAQEAFYVEMLAGNPPGAVSSLRASYNELEQMGERGFLSTIAGLLAHALYAQGDDGEAERFSRNSEDAAATDDVFSQVLWRTARAKVYARRGEIERAETLAREAVELIAATDNLNTQADTLSDLAEVLIRIDRAEDAKACLLEAAKRYEQKGNLVSLEKTRLSAARRE